MYAIDEALLLTADPTEDAVIELNMRSNEGGIYGSEEAVWDEIVDRSERNKSHARGVLHAYERGWVVASASKTATTKERLRAQADRAEAWIEFAKARAS